GFQSLEIERSRLTRAPVIGVAAPARRRDRNAMGPAREACHLAQYPAVPAVDDRHSIAMRHIYPVRGGIEEHVVPSIRGAERHRATHSILGHRLCSAGHGESQRERDGSERGATEESFHAATTRRYDRASAQLVDTFGRNRR